MKIKYLIIAVSTIILFVSGCASDNCQSTKTMSKKGKKMPPFGGASDAAYAHNLWNKMQKMGLNTTNSKLYYGKPPHGIVREVLEGKIDNHLVIVKRNYRGKGLTLTEVSANRAKYLASITVMAKRPGYDPADKNWFWVKYKPNGKIIKNPKGMKLAGKVAKGMPIGCISCHASAPGGDFMFIQNKNISPKATFVGSMGM